MNTDRDRLVRLLGGTELADLRRRLRRRYELARRSDRFTLSPVSAPERKALEGLLGRRPSLSKSIELSETELSEALSRAGLASSLRGALEIVDGPVADLALDRASKVAKWGAVFADFESGPLRTLIGSGAGRGLIKRLSAGDPANGAGLLRATVAVLSNLPAKGVPLSRLAAEILGDAHGLDEGRPVSTLALNALRGEGSGERNRDVWARYGLLVSELAAPVLVLNLPSERSSPGGELAERARELGKPLHLSLHELQRSPPRWEVLGRVVYVCENASVVAVAADRLGKKCLPLVCTDGMPSASNRVLLAQLAEQGAELRYHGDFDWAGISIGNFVVRTFAAKPWRYSAADYETSKGRFLEGSPVDASWDQTLRAKMEHVGYVLEEENVIEHLVHDLAAP